MAKSGRGISPEIVAALIGVAGTIVVAVFFNQPQSSSDTPTPVPFVITATFMPTAVPTDTVPPGESTSTPAPTDTPIPEPTDIPAVPIGQDWTQGCISSLWTVYPTTVTAVDQGDGCLLEPVHVFEAVNGSLRFVAQRNGSGPVEDYGMFAPLPESGSVSFVVSLEDLNNVDLWVGIFPEPDLRSNGLLLTIPAGNVRKRVITQKDVFTYETLQATQNLDQGSGFSFTFTFNSVAATGNVNPFIFKTNPFSMPAAEKWVYIGYRGLSGSYRVEGSFSNLIIE
ncbi:MAG TPA: hypothetical protein VK851_12175 [Anaerolineales bacterium]|nr:hypothetical protein [Anaerolineales bacterium]